MAQRFVWQRRLNQKYQEDVWKLLKDADGEFVPPLSSREKTTQAALAPTDGKGDARGPVKYFEQMLGQSFVLAVKDGRVNGFLTYIPEHELSLEGRTIKCNYISTIIVEPASRRKGITRRMYQTLFEKSLDLPVATRTWSTNHEHLGLLQKLDFSLAARLENDRGPGIDTVYYVKKLDQGTDDHVREGKS